jgi:hypothetical protein
MYQRHKIATIKYSIIIDAARRNEFQTRLSQMIILTIVHSIGINGMTSISIPTFMSLDNDQAQIIQHIVALHTLVFLAVGAIFEMDFTHTRNIRNAIYTV